MIALNKSLLSGLMHTIVTNNWIVYQMKVLLWLKIHVNLSTSYDVEGC